MMFGPTAPYASGDPGPLCVVEQATNRHDPLTCVGCAQRRRDAANEWRGRIGAVRDRETFDEHQQHARLDFLLGDVAPRASLWPLARLVLLAFLAGVLFGASIAFALSVLSSSRIPQDPVRVAGFGVAAAFESGAGESRDGGSTVRAGVVTHPADVARPLSLEARAGREARDDRGAVADPPREASPASSVPPATPARTTDLIAAAALRHGLDPDELVRVAMCESTLRPLAIGRDQELGLFQFKPTTWEFLARVSGLGYSIERIFDVEAQAELAAWGMANGYRSWWTCAR